MTKAERLMPVDVLKELVQYDPESGKIVWRVRDEKYFSNSARCVNWNNKYVGKEAVKNSDGLGYRQGIILGRTYKAHRIAWCIVNSRWPIGQIDHINGNRSDNRIENLREVTHRQNAKNRCVSKNNTSGVSGVTYHKLRSRWQVRIGVDGRCRSIGYFKTFEEAVSVRIKANKEYNYSSRGVALNV